MYEVISSSPGELTPVFRTMLENAVRICEARFGDLFLHEGEGFRNVAQQGPQSKQRDSSICVRRILACPSVASPKRKALSSLQMSQPRMDIGIAVLASLLLWNRLEREPFLAFPC